MVRTIAVLCLTLLAAEATADVLIVKVRGKPQIYGLPKEVDGIEVTLDTWEIFADQSSGVIDREGYDAVVFARRKGAKAQTFERDDVMVVRYSSEPDVLLDAYELMDAGNFTRAIQAFRETMADAEARDVFKLQANFNIGACYLSQGKNKSAAAHYAKWPAGAKSTFTPQVHRILAEILTAAKQYDRARTEYRKIEALEGITENWKQQAQLGIVKIGIAERKFDEAEREARSIEGRLAGKTELADALALAYVLQAEAILQGGDKERLPEAESALRRGADLEGVSASNSAYLYVTLGHVLYAQNKLEEARFPYMRVACLWPGERDFAASALQNAGQIFLDLAGRQDDQAKNDAMFRKGMRLLRECAGNYRGQGAAKKAGQTYLSYKKRYEDLLARDDEGDGDTDAEKDADTKGAAGK